MPSEPLIATPLALLAVTVSVDDAPGAIEAGFAVMVTLTGPAVGAACPFLLEPQPVTNTSRATKRAGTRQ